MLNYGTPVAQLATGLSDAATGVPALVSSVMPIMLVFVGLGLFMGLISWARSGGR